MSGNRKKSCQNGEPKKKRRVRLINETEYAFNKRINQRLTECEQNPALLLSDVRDITECDESIQKSDVQKKAQEVVGPLSTEIKSDQLSSPNSVCCHCRGALTPSTWPGACGDCDRRFTLIRKNIGSGNPPCVDADLDENSRSSDCGSDSSSQSSGILETSLESGALESSGTIPDQSSHSACPFCENLTANSGLFELCDVCNERLSVFGELDGSGLSDFFGSRGVLSP